VRITFVAPFLPRPVGGIAVIFEFASAMAARGHEIHLCHADPWGSGIELSSVDDITWFDFPPGVTHHFPEWGDAEATPDGDLVFCHPTEVEMPARCGLPVVFIQGYKMWTPKEEEDTFHAPCPKICVASWLVEVGRELGVPAGELFHVPCGFHVERYPLLTPLDERPPRIAFNYNTHFRKRPEHAIEVITLLRKKRPDVEVWAFGSESLEHELPPDVAYHHQPSPEFLVEEIYNGSRIYLCTSEVEGFGLPSVESMSCGAALVTTDNGGSRDYAFHDETALVSPYRDIASLTDNIVALLDDDDRRRRLARAGRDWVQRFTWSNSAEALEAALEEYLANPEAHGHRR
jgi:glycosyltransferase involved in cell wall biosynthesis